jgi:hypothetical protein
MNQAAESAQKRKADRLMRVGLVVTAIGLAFSFVALSPLVITGLELSSIWWALSMITGVGFAILLFGLRASARVRSKRQSLK